jgi:putative MATE family efflux protein
MLALALPVLAEQLLGVMVGYVDMILTGHLLHTDAHIAAMGSLAYLLWLLNSLFAAAAIGATAVVARLVGEGKLPLAAHASNQALLVGLLSSIPITLLYLLGGETLSRWLQLDAVAAELAGRYLFIIALAVPLIAVQRVGIASLRGAGDTISGMVAMVLVNVVNLVVGLVLVTGWGPFPNLGWDGLAIGTAVGNAVGGVLILAYLVAGRAGLPLSLDALRPDMPMIRRLLRVGIPGGIDTLSILLCHLWYLSIINAVSTLDAAAHGLGVRIESLAYLPGTAFQVAAATIAGQALGAADPLRARHGVWMATLVGGALMTAAGVLFAFTPDVFALLFLGTTESPVASLTIFLLKIVAMAMPALAVVMILSGALRGAGDTRVPLLITFAGYLLLRIPAAYLLAWDEIPLPLVDITLHGAGWGAAGAWIAMVVDIYLRASLVLWRFTHGGWTRVKV